MKVRLDEFIATLEPTLKPTTCQTYKSHLRTLHEWLSSNNVALVELGRNHMTQWFTYLYNQGLHPKTRFDRIAAVRLYLRWLHEEGEIEKPGDELIRPRDLPKLPSYLPRPLAPEADRELQKRLEASNHLVHQGLLLMRRTGVRIGELRSFEYNCIRADQQGRPFIKVPLGKLNNERLVPLDDATAKLVEKLQKQGRPARRWLLETVSAKQTRSAPYQKALHKICEGIDIPDRVTTHRLRHTYATSLIAGGMSLLALMKLLGHRDFRMTLRYAEIAQETIVQEYTEALTQIEKKYRRKFHATQEDDFDPVKATSDVIRWIHKKISANDRQMRAAKLLIRRLERVREEIAAIRATQAFDAGQELIHLRRLG